MPKSEIVHQGIPRVEDYLRWNHRTNVSVRVGVQQFSEYVARLLVLGLRKRVVVIITAYQHEVDWSMYSELNSRAAIRSEQFHVFCLG